MATTLRFVYEVPVEVVYQNEEVADAFDESKRTGQSLNRILFERGQVAVREALQVGRTQYEGALIVVTGREPRVPAFDVGEGAVNLYGRTLPRPSENNDAVRAARQGLEARAAAARTGNDYFTLTTADVGRAALHAFGRAWPVADFIGRVLNQDVGKRVYLRGGVLQVENAEQFRERVEGRLLSDVYGEHSYCEACLEQFREGVEGRILADMDDEHSYCEACLRCDTETCETCDSSCKCAKETACSCGCGATLPVGICECGRPLGHD